MNKNSINAISPIDGRYSTQTDYLSEFFSEKALIKFRLKVEVEYFIKLTEIGINQLSDWNKKNNPTLRNIYDNFNDSHANEIKKIEKTTNHDVKAVEYFLKNKFKSLGFEKYSEFIHFGLTSQDINNTAIPLSLKEYFNSYYDLLENLLKHLKDKSVEYKDVTILARTHGQPASPTKLGKEFNVFIVRVEEQLKYLKKIPFSAKFGGATGNFNAHHIAYPEIDWKKFAESFVKNMGLSLSFPTTQIEHYDNLAAIFDNIKRINSIIIDFNQDMWLYISMDYFKQKIKKGEIGSSAMPHKVNPIDFENSEGNLGIANSIFNHLSSKLPISRLQRDLTDSTVLRNLGVPIAHTIIGINSTIKGINKILLNKNKIDEDLENNWIVISEAIQTVLRREGYPKPYEALKKLTRKNEKIDKITFSNFINSLEISEKVKKELMKISPFNYTGI
ncbi:MAG: adenylosuccinate lyase [Flavobacteriales bacterium]|nr:adenylosuccinate lyase [Flavobacteriales bacterium]|tara:strand:+ start:1419 stop:2756 length:1338 start_codon:yes stop_codon:yes gene_type:complete